MKLNLTKFLTAIIMLMSMSHHFLSAQSAGTDDAILQGFYWNTHPGDFSSDEGLWWDTIATVAPDLAQGGIQTVWTPPANKGFAGTFDMGYGVYDYYDFGSFLQKGTLRTRHGNASQLFNTIDVLHQNNLKVMGDLVLNHRAGAEETQAEECDYQGDGILEDRFTKFRPASGRAPMNAEDFHPTDIHCDLFGPYHDRVFFEDLCYFEDIDQVLNPSAGNDGWYHGPHNLGRAGDSLIIWGRYLLDEVGFDELRLDAVKHIEPGFLAPFLVEMAAGDQPFAVGELFDGDIGTLKGYRDQVEGFNTTFGAGSKDASIAIFDFNLRFAIRDFCNNVSGGYDMWNLNNAGLLFNGMPGEDIVTFVENHDFDRIGYSQTNCSNPDVVAQEGSTCLEFTIDSGHDPVVSDKHMGYAYIIAAEGRPSIFWKDWFWFGLKPEIKWQLTLRSAMASGSTTPIQFLNPFFSQGNGGDMFVLNRNGNNGEGGLVLAINDNPNMEASAFVNTPFSNMELKDYSDGYMFTQTAAFGDSRALIKTTPRNYSWYAPTGHYPTPPDAVASAFNLGSHEGAKLHFIALRAEDAASLIVNGAPIEVGDQLAIRSVGSSDAVSLGRIGQSFEWDGVHDMIFEVLGGANSSEAKGGLLNGEAFELLAFDKSTGTTELIASVDFATNNTNFTFDPLRPGSRGGSFPLTTTHSDASYQVGAISLITAFDTRSQGCVSTDAAPPAYDDGWQSGDANSTGFGSWSLSSTNNAGHFVFTSTSNGDGDSNQDGDIDTGGRAWGMFANSGGQSGATLDFSQPLAQGGIFSLKMDNGSVYGSVGFSLKNAAGADLLSFYFQGGNANYTLNDQNGPSDTGVGYTDEGLEISLSLTSATDFEMIITRLEDGSTTVLNGVLNLPATGIQQISRLFLFNNNSGFDSQANLYFNNLEICSTSACPIAGVNAGAQSVCSPEDNTYSQEITVNFNTTPSDGQLSVNGTTVPLNVVNGMQTVNLTGLDSDGNDVDVTVVLTGSEGCTLTADALLTAPDDCQPPQITCPEPISVDTEPGLCSANVTYGEPEGTDNLPGATTQRTSGQGSGTNFAAGVNTETYMVTDAAGNTSSCSFTITVNDMEEPSASCQNVTVQINGDGTATAVASEINDGSSDNCTGALGLSYSLTDGQITYTCYDVGNTYSLTLQVADEANNTSNCTSQVTVADGNGNCLQGETLDFDGNNDIVDFGDVNDFGTSDFTIEFWFNASSIVPANSLGGTYLLAKGLTSAGTPSGAGYGFRLNVENGQNELSFIIGTPSNKVSFNGITTDTWYHVAGVRKGSTLSLYVNGGLAQSVSTGSVINVNTNLSLGLGAVIRAPFGQNTTSFDGKIDEVRIWGEAFCQDEVVNYTSCALSGSETGLLAYYDFNQGFAGVDNSPENVLIDITANGNDGNLNNFSLDGSSSNWLAPGVSSTGSCSAYTDTTNPEINCPATVTVSNDPGLCEATVTYNDAIASDNCRDATITYSQNSGTAFSVGTTIVTATATDEEGNENQCTFDIIVADDEMPNIVCSDLVLNLTSPITTITPDQVDGGSSDNCIDGTLTNLSLSNNSFDCNSTGLSMVTLTGTDAAGNSASCNATITVFTGGLPGEWFGNDVGNSGTQGNNYSFDACTNDNGEFAVSGGGNNVTSSTTDNVAFSSQTRCGSNVAITAKIESVDPNGYGGLMIRESTVAGAKQVAIFSNESNVLRHETRYSTNGPKQVNSFYKPSPIWLRLERQGDWIFAYYSSTGAPYSFQYVHGVYVPMQNCIEVGLASFTYQPGQQATTVFSNVTITGGGIPTVEVPELEEVTSVKTRQAASLYPNPTNNIVNLIFEEGLNKDATIILRNPLGQVVEQRQLRAGDYRTEWDVSTLADGLYLFEIRQEGEEVQVLRLVKTQ